MRPVECLAQLPYPVLLSFGYGAFRLSREGRLFKFAIQESRLDIHLMDFEVASRGKREEESDGVGLRNRGKRFCEVNPGFLCETLCDQSGLTARDLAGRGSLDTEDPFATNWFTVARRGDQFERPNGHDRVHLGLHCGLPLITINRADQVSSLSLGLSSS